MAFCIAYCVAINTNQVLLYFKILIEYFIENLGSTNEGIKKYLSILKEFVLFKQLKNYISLPENIFDEEEEKLILSEEQKLKTKFSKIKEGLKVIFT